MNRRGFRRALRSGGSGIDTAQDVTSLMIASEMSKAWATSFTANNFDPTQLSSLQAWYRSDLGVTLTQSPVVSTGTTPPAVTLSGTPVSTSSSIEIDITLLGALGVAQFQWKLNGSVQQTGQTTAASFVLGSTGITASFGAGTYAVNDVYTSVAAVSAWADQSGVGDSNRNATQATGSKQPTINASDAAYGHRPTFSFASAGSQQLVTGTWSAGPTNPYTIILVGQSDQATTEYFCDGLAVGNRSQIQATSTTLAIGGSATINKTTALIASPAAVAGIYQVTANTSSAIYINNSVTSVVTGNVGTTSPTGFHIGGAFNSGQSLNGKVAEFIVYNGALSSANIGKVFSYISTLYGLSVG